MNDPLVAQLKKILEAVERKSIVEIDVEVVHMNSMVLAASAMLLPVENREEFIRGAMEVLYKSVMNYVSSLEGKKPLFLSVESNSEEVKEDGK